MAARLELMPASAVMGFPRACRYESHAAYLTEGNPAAGMPAGKVVYLVLSDPATPMFPCTISVGKVLAPLVSLIKHKPKNIESIGLLPTYWTCQYCRSKALHAFFADFTGFF